MTDLTVIILNYNTAALTLKCLKSIFKYDWQNKIKVIVADNGSKDNSVDLVRKQLPQVEIIENNANLGFSAGNNVALKQVESEYCLLINSDTEVTEGSLDNLIDYMRRSGVAVAGCKLVNPDGTFQPPAGDLPTAFLVLSWLTGLDEILNKTFSVPTFHAKSTRYFQHEREVGWVSGAAMMIKTSILKEIGYLDEKIFMYDEDIDFCMRVKKAGYKVGWTDKVTILHMGGASTDKPQLNQWLGEFKNLLYLYKKHYGLIQAFLLKIAFYIFIGIRIVVFALIGKTSYSKTYVEVLSKI